MGIFSSSTEFVKKEYIKNRLFKLSGFTLIELLVVIGIIATLFTTLAIIFNPFAQVQKAHNATRQEDLNHIKQALDAYLNDTGCYPASIPFGSKWAVGSVTYMTKVPQDPDCSAANPTYCYDYQTDGSACPQWNILYTTMHQPIATGISTCMLSTVSGCLPTNGLFTYNYCNVSGKLDCTYISQNPLPTPVIGGSGSGSGSGSSGSGSGGSVTPIPTDICTSQLYGCSNHQCQVESTSQCDGCGGSIQCYTDANSCNANCQ